MVDRGREDGSLVIVSLWALVRWTTETMAQIQYLNVLAGSRQVTRIHVSNVMIYK